MMLMKATGGSWDELQSIVSEYETVFVMAYLPDSPPSTKGLQVFDECVIFKAQVRVLLDRLT